VNLPDSRNLLAVVRAVFSCGTSLQSTAISWPN